jgi:hypothetical protein
MSRKTLTQCLEVFNRKERYWLIRNCCGNGENLALPLGEKFRAKLEAINELRGIDFENAWWAMDYHIDWLIAGLTLYQEQNVGKTRIQNDGYKICGTQEDFDFIVCSGNTLIFIEAKLSSGWDKTQLSKKLKRLVGMDELFKNIKKYFILVSPNFQNKDEILATACTILGNKVEHFCIKTPQGTDIRDFFDEPGINEHDTSDGKRFLKVTRCNEHGKPSDKGTHWTISPVRCANSE